MLAALLEGQTRLIRFEPGRVELRLDPIAPPTLPNQLSEAAKRLTGQRWVVMVGSGEGEATLAEQAEARRRQRIEELRHDPTFRPLLDTFPGAEIVDVREIAPAAARAAEPTLPRGIREA
jgi:DNA polymerase-3 subunit gamma/tau